MELGFEGDDLAVDFIVKFDVVELHKRLPSSGYLRNPANTDYYDQVAKAAPTPVPASER